MSLVSPHLRYFLETARLGSIRKASERLNISPSAVYRSIQNTELDLGATLFERTSKGVDLTPAGRVLAEYAERIAADGEHTVDRIKTLSQRDVSISVAGPDGVVPEIVFAGFNNLLANFPDTSVLFKGSSGIDALALLDSGVVDLALHFDLQVPENILVLYTHTLPLGVVTPVGHALSEKAKVTLDECCDWPLILPDSSWPMRTLLNGEILRRGLSPELRTVSSSITLMKLLVGQGHGVGIQTAIGMQREISDKSLVHIPMDEGPEFDRKLQLIARRDTPLSKRAEYLAGQIITALKHY